MTLSSDITKTQLTINRLSKEMYNELCAEAGRMETMKNELFLIDDPDFDVYNKKIINVLNPENGSDAINLNYLSTNYEQKNQIVDYIKKNNIYAHIVEKNLENGSQYINCENCYIYEKNTNDWQIVKISGDYDLSDITIKYIPGTYDYGWSFHYKDTPIGERNPLVNLDVLTYKDANNYLSASSWVKVGKLMTSNSLSSYISKTEISTCLSTVNENCDLSDILCSLINLKQKI